MATSSPPSSCSPVSPCWSASGASGCSTQVSTPSSCAFRVAGEGRLLPWVFVGPALLLLTLYLVWPAVSTILKSLTEGAGGLANYEWAVTTPANQAMYFNNVLWLVVGVLGSVGFGLLIAWPRRSGPVRIGRQDLHLPAPRHLDGGGVGHLAFRVRVAATQPTPVRAAQCHLGGIRPGAHPVDPDPGLPHQHVLPHLHPHLAADGLRHGRPVRGHQGRARGDHRGRAPRRGD